MLSLPQVLHEAQRHSVGEIAIERGQPVTFHGEQGALVLGDALVDADISEALSLVLAPEQQAELAVAGVVEFYVEGYAEWNLVAETAKDGVVIRGRQRTGDSPSEVGVPLELPPLRRFESDSTGDIPPSSGSVLHQAGHRATRWDVGVAEQEIPLTTPLGEPSSAEPGSAPHYEAEPGLPLGLGSEPSIDFALVAPELPPDDQPPPERLDVDFGRETTVPTLGVRTRPASRTTLLVHARAIEPGTMVYLFGTGLGDALLEHLDDGFTIIDDDTWATVTTMSFTELPVGRGYVVRLEDPSRCLSWLLRRIEEGARVVVEGRAQTSAGARRTLLGAEATPHLVQWLDAHPQWRLFPDGSGGWRLEPL